MTDALIAALANYPVALLLLYIMDRQHKGHLAAIQEQREELKAWRVWSKQVIEELLVMLINERPPAKVNRGKVSVLRSLQEQDRD